MQDNFETRMIEALGDEWRSHGDGGPIDSRDVYARLVGEGVDVPQGAMNEVFERLKEDGMISGPGYHDREGILLHGARYITGVESSLVVV